MNKLDLTKFGVQEMSSNEMMNIEGGSWLSNLQDGVCEGVGQATDWVLDTLFGTAAAALWELIEGVVAEIKR